MHKRADFHAKLASCGFERCLDFGGVEFLQRTQCVANSFEPRLVLGGEMFRDALRTVIEIVGKIEPTIGWQLVKCVYLAFAGLQRRANVLLSVIVDPYAARLQSRYGKVVKLGVAQLACIFAVQPMQFVGIKRRMAPPDMIEIENT